MRDRRGLAWRGQAAGHGDGARRTGLGATTASIRSIPPRTSTGRYVTRLRRGVTSASRNHSRPASKLSAPPIPQPVEPVVDVFDEGECILVVAEVPGADERSIRVELQDHTLRLFANGRFRSYRGEVGLPGATRPTSPAWTLNNGVINLRLARQKQRTAGC
jgi:HSP20 family molecular chaperone IbpA